MPKLVCGLVLVLALPVAAFGQADLTLPPSGDNQKASVSQWIGPVEVTITYHSPDVTSPTGEDRTGKIWGQLVPYGMANLGFGTCGDQCPWRAGANENTTFSVSSDVLIQGHPLAAGTYGVHMIPAENAPWTLIFSNDSTSWGSFFYDASKDALRVEVEPREHPYTHWLTYEFIDRQPAQATAALQWENLEVPWTIEVPDVADLYIEALSQELRNAAGFYWTNWRAAAQYAVTAGRAEQGLEWAEQAVSNPAVGQENFQTLTTLAQAQAAAGDNEAGQATLERALNHPTATALLTHFLGRSLLAAGQTNFAMWVFERNAELHPGEWPVELGLARGNAALGNTEEALAHAQKALAMAPDDLNRKSVQALIDQLESSGGGG